MSAPISPIRVPPAAELVRSDAASGASGFRSVLEGAIGRVDELHRDAAKSVDRFLTGEGEELHTTALATQRAELAFEMLLQTRNKVVQAYQEIMRMQM